MIRQLFELFEQSNGNEFYVVVVVVVTIIKFKCITYYTFANDCQAFESAKQKKVLIVLLLLFESGGMCSSPAFERSKDIRRCYAQE